MSKKKHKLTSSYRKKSSRSRSRQKVAQNAVVPYTSLTDRPDWLPDDWEIELKHRTTSCRTDRYFVCPVSGKKLRSELEVFDHLNGGVAGCLEIESPPSPRPPHLPRRANNPQLKNPQPKNLHYKNRRPKNRSTKSHRKLGNVPVIEHLAQVEDSPADLPEGWIKEIRPRRTGDKTDAYYIDPVHGYGFRSKKDVFRYLENEDLSRVVFILKRPPQDTLLMIDDSLPIVEFLKCTRKRSASKRRILDGNEVTCNSITPQRAAVLSSKYEKAKFEEGSSETACSTTVDVESSHHSDAESDDLKQCTEKQTRDSDLEENIVEINLEEGPKEAEKKIHIKSSVNLQGKRKPHPDEEKPKKVTRLEKGKVKNTETEAADDLIFNTDVGKRYAKLKSKQIEKKMKATMPREWNTKIGHEVVKPTEEHLDLVEKLSSIKIDINSWDTRDVKKHVNLFGGLNSEANIREATDSERLKEFESIKKSVESATDGQLQVDYFGNVPIFIYNWSDPHAFKTLTTDLNDENVEIEDVKDIEPCVEEKVKKSEKGYDDYSWSDPCIEFAFKTLTSDFSSFEDYLNLSHKQHHSSSQHPASSVNTHKLENEKYKVFP